MGAIRQALRQLAKSPAYTAVAVLTLALGIGVNTTTFTVINALLLTPPKFEEPARIAYIYSVQPQSTFWGHSTGEAKAIHDLNSVFSQVAMMSWASPSFTEPGRPAERLTTMTVTPDFFPLLGTPPAMGRWFSPAEANATGVAVVSNRFWRSRLAADPNAVGRTLRIDGAPVTVVGVMPSGLDDPINWGHIDLWTPLALGDKGWDDWNSAWIKVMARLKPGVSMAQAQADMDVLSRRFAHDHPVDYRLMTLKIMPLLESRIEGTGRRMSWLTMDLTAFVLLIACVNLANLQLAQSMRRAREHAIRLALGCSRWRLARHLLAESFLLSVAGAVLGFLIASWLTGALGHRIVIADEAGLSLPLDLRVAAFTLAAAVATTAAFGIVPAWAAARSDASSALRSGGRAGTEDRSRHRLRKTLVVAEVAAALVILSGAAYFVRGTLRLTHRDFGWKPDGLLIGSIDLPWAGYSDDDKSRAFATSLRSRLAEVPGVEAVSLSEGNPAVSYADATDFVVEGKPVPEGKEPIAGFEKIQPGFIGLMGIRLVEGRDFAEADLRRSPAPILVNLSAARRLWPGKSAVGRKLGFGPRNARVYREVVGVVNDVTIPSEAFQQDNDLSGIGPSIHYQFYSPFGGSRSLFVSLRTSADPHLVEDGVRAAVAAVDPNVAIYHLSTAREKVSDLMANFTLVGQVLLGMAALGLVLAAVGIYGVIASLTEQRTREIGIRAALGARRSEVLWLVMRTGLLLSAGGCAIGLCLSAALARLLSRVMPEIPGGGPAPTLAMALLITVVALAACWLPARRAANVDPIEALRCE